MRTFIIILLFSLLCTPAFSSGITITHRAPESAFDTRFDYPLALIVAAMEATKDEYGGYQLVQAPNMNFQRAQLPYYIEKLENFVFENAASKENEEKLLSIKIPIAKGLYGYRLFLIHKDNQPLFDQVTTLEDLKQLRIGVGRTWLDSPILSDNGFRVVTGGNYEGLFRMLITRRFDGFSRGINEAFHEQEERVHRLPELAVEKALCLHYPMPRYFYTAKGNTAFAGRLTQGLETIIANGTFDEIWLKYHHKFLVQADLENRTIFRISNPYIPDSVPLDDPKYFYLPKEN